MFNSKNNLLQARNIACKLGQWPGMGRTARLHETGGWAIACTILCDQLIMLFRVLGCSANSTQSSSPVLFVCLLLLWSTLCVCKREFESLTHESMIVTCSKVGKCLWVIGCYLRYLFVAQRDWRHLCFWIYWSDLFAFGFVSKVWSTSRILPSFPILPHYFISYIECSNQKRLYCLFLHNRPIFP